MAWYLQLQHLRFLPGLPDSCWYRFLAVEMEAGGGGGGGGGEERRRQLVPPPICDPFIYFFSFICFSNLPVPTNLPAPLLLVPTTL